MNDNANANAAPTHLSSVLDTEKVNPATSEIDRMSPLEIVQVINAEDEKVALTSELGVHHGLNHRDRDANFRNCLHAIEHAFVEACLAGGDLKLSRACDTIHGLAKSVEHGLICRMHAHEHGYTQHDARQGEHPAQQMPAHIGPANELEQDHESERPASRRGLPRYVRRRARSRARNSPLREYRE